MEDTTKNITFATNKPHVSFSEVRIWKECSWKHKLMYIDKVLDFEAGIYTEYGSILHESIEDFLKTKDMKTDVAIEKLKESWSKYEFDKDENVKERVLLAESQGWKYKHNFFSDWSQWCKDSLEELPGFLDKNYPGWELVSAEEELYEKIDDELSFKGFIDCVLRYPKGKKWKYVIIDWKTAGPRGWSRDKKQDIKTTAQIMLYKHYWSEKNNVPLKDIACNFVLLKRGTKKGKICKIVEVSAGPVSIERANKMVSSMISGVRRSFFMKNRLSCKFCPFAGTEHCT
jgi:hypothetical protein